MKPIETPATDTLYVGPDGVGDLPVETILEVDGTALHRILRSRWRPTEEERVAIALGGDVVLDVFGSALPPVRVLASTFPTSLGVDAFDRIDALVAKAWALTTFGLLAVIGLAVPLETIEEWDPEVKEEVSSYLASLGPEEEPEPIPLALVPTTSVRPLPTEPGEITGAIILDAIDQAEAGA